MGTEHRKHTQHYQDLKIQQQKKFCTQHDKISLRIWLSLCPLYNLLTHQVRFTVSVSDSGLC